MGEDTPSEGRVAAAHFPSPQATEQVDGHTHVYTYTLLPSAPIRSKSAVVAG